MFHLENDRIEQHWSTPIFQGSYSDTAELHANLEGQILDAEAKLLHHNSKGSSLIFNSFSALRHEQNFMQWDHPCILHFHEMITPSVIRYLKENYPDSANNFEIKSWANLHRYGDWHGAHSHFAGGNEIASGVYWVKCPIEVNQNEALGGRLILFDPRGPFFPERKKIIITPEPGKLIIFPAWLQHEVTPLKTEQLRISVAFDVHRL